MYIEPTYCFVPCEQLSSGVTIGLEMTTYFTDETGGPLTICARMFLGNLERNLSVTLVSADGTAVGMI